MFYSKISFTVCFFLPPKSVQRRKGRTSCWPAVQVSGSSTTVLLRTRYRFPSQSTSVVWIWVFREFWSQWSYLLVSFLKPLLLVSSGEESAKYNLMEAGVIYLTSLPFLPGAQPPPRALGRRQSRDSRGIRKVPSNVTKYNFFVSDRTSRRVQ